MANEVPVFIISHELAETMTTYEVLNACGYTGQIFIVIDDKDKQIDLYRELYKEKIIVFSKDEVSRKCDTMDNFKVYTSALYARVFCWHKAKELGYQQIVVCDDDITNFCIRYVKDEKLKYSKIKDLNTIIRILGDFLAKTGIAAIGPVWENSLHGGKNGSFREGLIPNTAQFEMVNIGCNNVQKWRGTRCEDEMFLIDNWNAGNPVYVVTTLAFGCPKRMEGDGGLQSDYAMVNKWIIDSYFFMAYPGGYQCTTEKIKRCKPNLFPKVISEKWRKKSCR